MDLLNLQRLSAITISSKIWESPDLLDKIKELRPKTLSKKQKILPCYLNLRGVTNTITVPAQNNEPFRQFQLLISSATQRLDSIKLPIKIKNYCQDVIREMGEKIYDLLVAHNNLDLKLPGQIYWTPYGFIDESKIFESWASEAKISEEIYYKPQAFFNRACINAQEDFIRDHQNEMEFLIRNQHPYFNFDCFYQFENYHHKVYTLMFMFLSSLIGSADKEILDIKDFNSETSSRFIILPDQMLKASAFAVWPKAVAYYWKMVNIFYDEGDETVTQCLLDTIKACLAESNFFMRGRYQRDKIGEIIIYLMNQIPEPQRNEFIQKNVVKIFRRLLPVWPFNEMVLSLIDNYSSSLSASDYQVIFKFILHAIKDDKGKTKVKYFHFVFEKILTGLPALMKKEVFDNDFLDQNIHNFDTECLVLLLQNMDDTCKSDVIHRIQPFIPRLIKDDKKETEALNEFLKIVIAKTEENAVKDDGR